MSKPTVSFFQSEQDQLKAQSRAAKLADPYLKLLGNPTRTGAKILQIVHAGTVLDCGGYSGEAGTLVWAAMGDFTAKLVVVGNGEVSKGDIVKKVLRGHSGPVTCVALLPSTEKNCAQLLLTGSWDKTIRLWNANTRETIGIFEGHTDFVKCISVNYFTEGSETFFYSGSSDSTVKKWKLPSEPEVTKEKSITTIRSVETLEGHKRAILKLAISKEGESLYTASSDNSIKKWDISGERICQTYIESPQDDSEMIPWGFSHKTNINDLTVTEDSVWTGSADKTVCELDQFTGRVETDLVHNQIVKSILPIPEKGIIFVGLNDGEINVWDLRLAGFADPEAGHSMGSGNAGSCAGTRSNLSVLNEDEDKELQDLLDELDC
ncbi:putative WD repeat-containing protein [Smittium mucronatum]|uniref:Putative WD repeat-containing protein n=1 Tax=Smittium mucronatum TaxID=133383 RepID=A0A1R0H362_9FUNG|nr:putative WD repeat-containing protein [Smittium mucronatum]